MAESKYLLEAQQAQTLSALLELGKPLGHVSLLLSAVALTVLWLVPHLASPAARFLQGSLVLALVQTYYALRVALDARLLANWAQAWLDGRASPAATLVAFDQTGLWRNRPSTGIVRPLAQRLAGARRLWQRQVLCVVMQLVTVLLAAWLA